MSADQIEMFNTMFPESDRGNVAEMGKRFLEFSLDMYTNHETYKTLRKIIYENFNAGRFSLDGEVELNKAFEESAFKESYLDFVANTLQGNKGSKIPYYNFYQQCYLMLDMFGIDKDKIKQKNNFINLFNDSLHSYYGQFCDYFVTEDESIMKKTKAMYQLLDITTKVVNAKGLLSVLPNIGLDSESNFLHFFANLWNDIIREPEVRSTIVDVKDEDSISYHTNTEYLNYFNQLCVLNTEDSRLYILCKKDQSDFVKQLNYRERGQIVDKCITIFGMDLELKKYFDFQQEVEEIRSESWTGRYWKAFDWLIRLAHEDKWGGLVLIISPILG